MVAAKAIARCALPFRRLPFGLDRLELLLELLLDEDLEEGVEPRGVTLPSLFLVEGFLVFLPGEREFFLAGVAFSSTCLKAQFS